MSHSDPMLKIAVVGHTNAGKTSLLRTLLQSREFGEVDQRPSTTRNVLEQGVSLNTAQIMSFYDTPGLESGSDLYAELDQLGEQYRHDGPAQIRAFLAQPEAETIFAQEAKVMRQLLQSDAAFYVIDCRDPVLPKYQDELHVLARCGKPLLPVLNFTAAHGNRERDWQQALAKLNLHAVVAFDTVTPPEGGERQLLQSLAVVLPSAQPKLEKLIAHRYREREQRRQRALQAIAEMLTDVAGMRHRVPLDANEDVLEREVAALQNRVRRREHEAVQDLLARFAFLPNDAVFELVDIGSGQWHDDLFASDTLKVWSKDTGFGVGAGAAAGAGIDLMVGGMSLGLAAALGAAAGGLYQSWRHFGEKLKQRIQGERELGVDPATLATIAGRQLYLLEQLSQRGHAATDAVAIAKEHRLSRDGFRNIEKILAPVMQDQPDLDKQKIIQELAKYLRELTDNKR
ncbi:GTPase/DUF3482 domain-containing protein [Pseudidiomarina terrestris]|uniref:GTPase/DUF3482 domain-containing protein n=1 Tax=Pseudidiomarina terrestris TaxID=2820060 RepID=UPI00264BDBB6|nr:GTPase/DUF3482 domain-containing protein [Pseudidiomarina sp. 1ASP75-5]MDN7135226.1 GTPase/DUF3482 domain-containing protein [Pseudidiomarina sp. 1ASP75-5]